MQYEWNETKREANLRKHGYDFADADLVYDNINKMTVPAIRANESRSQDIALVEVQGKILSLVYVLRGYTVRVISFRMASRKERRIYDDFRAKKSN